VALQPAADSTEYPLGADARLSQAEALRALGRDAEADSMLAREKETIASRRDRRRQQRMRAIEKGERVGYGEGGTKGALASAIEAHLKLADQAERSANSRDALEHYRAARVLLEVR
jgi:hypothetical protein